MTLGAVLLMVVVFGDYGACNEKQCPLIVVRCAWIIWHFSHNVFSFFVLVFLSKSSSQEQLPVFFCLFFVRLWHSSSVRYRTDGYSMKAWVCVNVCVCHRNWLTMTHCSCQRLANSYKDKSKWKCCHWDLRREVKTTAQTLENDFVPSWIITSALLRNDRQDSF